MIDFIVLAIIGAFAYNGYRRGLMLSAYRMVSFFLAIFIAQSIYPYITNALVGFEPLRAYVYNNVLNYVSAHAAEVASKAEDAVLGALNIPSILSNAIAKKHIISSLVMRESVYAFLADYITDAVISAVSMAAVGAVTTVILFCVSQTLKVASRLPVINNLNRAGGCLAGLVTGIFAVWVLLAFSLLFVKGGAFPLNEMINQSTVAKNLQDTNIIIKIISTFVSARH